MQYTDVRQQLRDLFKQTKSALAAERTTMLEAVRLIGELHASNPWVNLGVNESTFLAKLGISRDRYYGRVRAARALGSFPELEEAFLAGEVALSTIAMIESKLSRYNIDAVLANIKGKTKREAVLFMSKVTPDGSILDQSGSVELTLMLSEEELEAFNRLREALAARGQTPKNSEVLIRAVEDSLEKRDPVRKAQRAEKRRQKRSSEHVVPVQQTQNSRDQAIPMKVQHQVWLRDEGQCSHQFPDGSRCEARGHLELDHRQMRCRGGNNDLDNIRLVCRRHNQHYAEAALGNEFMRSKRLQLGLHSQQ